MYIYVFLTLENSEFTTYDSIHFYGCSLECTFFTDSVFYWKLKHSYFQQQKISYFNQFLVVLTNIKIGRKKLRLRQPILKFIILTKIFAV